MFHLVTLLSTLLWRRPVVRMNVSDIHSDDAVTSKEQSVTEAVASTSHRNSPSPADFTSTSVDYTSTSVDAAPGSESIFENESASKNERDVDVLEVQEDAEPFLIDLTTLLPQEENACEDDICITKVVPNKNPLAELMAKRKKNKDSKSEAARTAPSSSAESSDNFLKDLVKRSRKYAEARDPSRSRSRSKSRGSSEKRHYSRISNALSEKQCGEEEGQTDENSNLGLWNRSESPPPPTDERRDSFSLSPTYKRKMEPFKKCFEAYGASCFRNPTYSESAMQPSEKRIKHSPAVEKEPAIVIELSSSSSEENSPCTSRRKKRHRPTLPRKWEWSDFGWEYRQKRNEYPGVEFTIMSYNLLAQDLLEKHPHLYTHCDWDVLLWEYRRARLLEEIDQHLPDIMCFQEVQSDHCNDFLKPELEKRGYIGVYCKKSGYQSDGCATFFNVMKFDLLNLRKVYYQQGDVLDRANVGLIVSLKPKTSDPNLDTSELYIANTHLLFNPRRGDVKLAQLILFLAELDKAAYKCRKSSKTIVYHPTILCGDFNLEPFSRIYRLIVSRYMRYEGLLIREMAGTSEDHLGRDSYMPKNFFPSYLFVTDSCQFAENVRERNLKDATKESSPAPADPSLENNEEKPSDSAEPESSRQPSPSPWSKEIAPPQDLEETITPIGSGEISHFFKFVSTYDHLIKDKRHSEVEEVTSYHDRACGTTDYIFYNVDKRSRKKRSRSAAPEGRLKLLRRYKLFSAEDVKKMDRLPNAELGSDHFSLLAHFLLT